MSAVVFCGEDFQNLRNTLLSYSPNEAAAVLLAGSAQLKRERKLLVREIIPVPQEGYVIQKPFHLAVSPVVLAPLIKRARLEAWSIVLVHSHPFSDGPPRFSFTDDEGESKWLPAIFNRVPNRPHASLVVGAEGFAGRLWASPRNREELKQISEVGPAFRQLQQNAQTQPNELMFERSIRAFGFAGQRLLRTLTVAVVGLGGTGSMVSQELAHLGVGKLVLLDPDVVETTNLNRLVGISHQDVGRPKVDVAGDLVHRVRPNAEVVRIRGSVLKQKEATELLETDFIFSCTDTHGSRAVLNQIAYQYFIPVIDLGVRVDSHLGMIEKIVGRIQMLAPTLPCLVCQNFLDTEEVRRDLLSNEERKRDPYIVGDSVIQPSVISINGVVASLAVTMFLSATVGLPMKDRHQLYLAEKGVVKAIGSKRDDRCVVCSLNGALGRGDSWPLPWRTA